MIVTIAKCNSLHQNPGVLSSEHSWELYFSAALRNDADAVSAAETCSDLAVALTIMAGIAVRRNGVASARLCPAIHVFVAALR
jgi:hypothetical protein